MDERDHQQVNNPVPDWQGNGVTLESILAEYKGSAFIEGAKRTPREKLEEETERIVREAISGEGKAPEEAAPFAGEVPSGLEAEQRIFGADSMPAAEAPTRQTAPKRRRRPAREVRIKNAYEIQYDVPRAPEDEEPEAPRRPGEAHIEAFSDMSETEQEFYGVGKYARASAVHDNAQETDEVIDEEARRQARKEAARRQARPRRERHIRREKELEPELPEPSLRESGALYAKHLKSLKRRSLLAFVLSILLVYLCLALQAGMWIPPVLRENARVFALTALIGQLLVLYLGRDLLVRGIADLFKGRAGAESLVSVACIASVLDALSIAISGAERFGAPFCAVAAFSMACALRGTFLTYQGFRNTYKTAISSSEPYVVTPELDRVKDGAVLVKRQIDSFGFVSRADEEDGAAHAYAFAAPLLLIAALALSLFAAAHSGMDTFFHNFAAMTCASASFAALICYGLPFAYVSKLLSKAGAAIAGWSGACDISDSVGVVITDRDIFPAGTMAMNGVRVFAAASLNKVLSYAGSVVIASGSGLSTLFAELLRQQNCSTLPVENFVCFEGGGIGAEIRGEKVLVGSSGFMHLMGVHVPNNLGIKSAVYAAISGELVGVFSVDYTPVNSVQNALVRLLETKVLPLLAVRDFNMTPMMIQQKFKITTDKLEYLTADARYQLSDERDVGPARPVALLCREGLGPLGETIAAGRQFRKAVYKNTVLSLIGTALGLLLSFYLCWNGAFASLTAANLFAFLFAWLVPVLLLSGTVKRY